MRISHYMGHTVVTSLFKKDAIAFDCGANMGHYAGWLSRNSDMQIYSFEADPRIFPLIPAHDRVKSFPMAVAAKTGTIELGLGDATCSSIVYRESSTQPSVKVEAISLDDFCMKNEIGKICFIKMDIEGAELDVLENVSESLLRNTCQISVEFHDLQAPGDLPRIQAVVQRLRGLGFYSIRLNWHTWGDCLFINRSMTKLSVLDRFKLELFGKYLPGVTRIIKRTIGSK